MREGTLAWSVMGTAARTRGGQETRALGRSLAVKVPAFWYQCPVAGTQAREIHRPLHDGCMHGQEPPLAQQTHVISDWAGGGGTPLWGRHWDDSITDRPYPSKVPMSGGTTQNATWPVWHRHHYSEEGPTVTQARVLLGWGSPLQGGDTTPGKADMGPNTGLAWPTLVLSVR